MSRVYLQEIPNAPQRLADPAVMSGGPSAPDLGGVTQTLLQSGIQQGAFDGPAEGVQRVAESVKGLARPLAAAALDWAQMKSDANDAINKGRRQALRTEWYYNLTAQTEGLPESEWVPQFEKALPKLNEALAKYPLSRRASPEEDGYQLNWVAERKGSLHIAATRQAFEKGMVTLVGGYQQAIAQGDIEGAKRLGDQLEAGRFWSPGQRRLEDEKAIVTLRDNALAARLQNDPRGVQSELQAAEASGTVEKTFGPMPPEKLAVVKEYADRGALTQDAAETFESVRLIRDRVITSGEELRKRFPKMSEKALALADGYLAPRGDLSLATHGAAFAEANTAILGYDGRTDGDLSRLHAIQGRIAELPWTYQKQLSEQLEKRWSTSFIQGKAPASREVELAARFREYERAAKAGAYGPTGRSPVDWNKVTDSAASNAWAERYLDFQNRLTEFSQQNPQALPQQWAQFMDGLLKPRATAQAAAAFAQRTLPLQSGLRMNYPGGQSRADQGRNELRRRTSAILDDTATTH